MTAFVKSRRSDDGFDRRNATLLPSSSHVLNTNPADIPNLPIQIVMSAKKDSPQQVAFRESFDEGLCSASRSGLLVNCCATAA